LSAFRQAHKPIIHILRIYKESADNVDLCRRALIESGQNIVTPDSTGAELVEFLKPASNISMNSEMLLNGGIQNINPNEWIMYKPRWGAFYQTRLEEFLRELSMNTLLFCGCNFPNCPRTSIYEASERDFKTILATDAVSGIYERGLQELEGIGVNLLRTDAIISKIV
jgi:nicotinamidase-related amidase